MTRDEIIYSAEQFTLESPCNFVSEKVAMKPEYIGMKMFDSPIFAFGSANDELYTKFKDPEVIGSHFLLPTEWLPAAKTVISFFLPYTDRIKVANAFDYSWPAREWLHGRVEGQFFVKELTIHICMLLAETGYLGVAPSLDLRIRTGKPLGSDETTQDAFTSNWSERHAAFACGLGTFGLSKGLITAKGVCGRFGSVLTDLELEYDKRSYSGIDDYCTNCGACILNCPVKAISSEGKDDLSCSDFLDKVHSKHKPWYGCGKCQVGVPCESEAPGA